MSVYDSYLKAFIFANSGSSCVPNEMETKTENLAAAALAFRDRVACEIALRSKTNVEQYVKSAMTAHACTGTGCADCAAQE